MRYLSKTRTYRYKDISLEIAPEVFHPGFFFSTQLLLKYISRHPLKEKRFLEFGCGNGLISIVAAKHGAKVTASDINPVAISYLEKNSRHNRVNIEIIESDLFKNIVPQVFDIIAINPPYYKKQPLTPGDYAWFCGGKGEYYAGLFHDLKNYMDDNTEIIMVLFDGCDMNMINGFAKEYGFYLDCILSRQNMLEKNFIFKIVKDHC